MESWQDSIVGLFASERDYQHVFSHDIHPSFSGDIVPALAAASLFDLSPESHTGRTSMVRSVQVLNEIAVSDYNLSSPPTRDNQSLSLL